MKVPALWLCPLCALMSAAPVTAQIAGAPGAGVSSCAKECHQDIVSHQVMHKVSQQRCDACHVQGNPKQHRFSFIAETERLCTRCHSIPHEGVTHAPVQQGRCLECHDPHGSEHPRSLRADPQRDLCVKCHQQDFSKAPFVHGPVAVGACIVCHKPHSSGQPALLVKESRSLCLTCHGEVEAEAQREGHVHAALQQGCTTCHAAHASQHKHQLRATAPELCMTCHKEYFDRVTAHPSVVHGAVWQPDGCTACHDAHSSPYAGLQRASQPEICLSCHGEQIRTAQGETLTNMAQLLKENPDHHGPIRDGNCTACHAPHASRNFRLLAEEYPAPFYAPFDIGTFKLCFTCHMPDLVLSESGTGLTAFRDGNRNLHHLHVNREKGRTCRSCHEVHASKHPSHIRDAVPFGGGNWMLPINYKRTVDGGSCMPGCHEVRRYSRTQPAAGTPSEERVSPAADGPPAEKGR